MKKVLGKQMCALRSPRRSDPDFVERAAEFKKERQERRSQLKLELEELNERMETAKKRLSQLDEQQLAKVKL